VWIGSPRSLAHAEFEQFTEPVLEFVAVGLVEEVVVQPGERKAEHRDVAREGHAGHSRVSGEDKTALRRVGKQ
jgi:hypothetical protein